MVKPCNTWVFNWCIYIYIYIKMIKCGLGSCSLWGVVGEGGGIMLNCVSLNSLNWWGKCTSLNKSKLK